MREALDAKLVRNLIRKVGLTEADVAKLTKAEAARHWQEHLAQALPQMSARATRRNVRAEPSLVDQGLKSLSEGFVLPWLNRRRTGEAKVVEEPRVQLFEPGRI